MTADVGVLLLNIGSPEQPTPEEVRNYLKKFLSDPHVVNLPRLIWLPILYGIILPTRSKKSAALYQKIWTPQGSPLLYHSQQIAEKLSEALQLPVALGTHYGKPTIPDAINHLKQNGVKKIIILPLYPQYSDTTTVAGLDQVTSTLKNSLPTRIVKQYADDENYIAAICQSIQDHNIEHLLFSFHGIPQQCIEKGDPYYQQCLTTVKLITEKLSLPSEKWTLSFQSRLGYAKWLEPYTTDVLTTLPKNGIKNLHVICPGFAADCLETLEEIAIRGKEQFLEAGGENFHYIPALNAEPSHISALKQIIQKNLNR